MYIRLTNSINRISSGFTLIEVLVALFIVSSIATTAIYSHREFVDNMEISNLAYDLSLSIRDVQVRASGGEYDFRRGIHFNIGNNPSYLGDSSAFVIFSDSYDPQDEIYNYSNYTFLGDCNNEECVQVVEIGRGNFIEQICYKEYDSPAICSFGEFGTIVSVDLTFDRPRLDTKIRFRDSSGDIDSRYNDAEAIICLSSPIGRKKSIHILQSGQISVDSHCY